MEDTARAGETKLKAPRGSFLFFSELSAFSKAVTEATGTTFDFESLAEINTNLIEPTEQYLILSLFQAEGEPNLLLCLTQENAFLYAEKPPGPEISKGFEKVLNKPFGRATVLAFGILNRIQDSFKRQLESLITATKQLEVSFDFARYREIALEFERLNDRLEELHDLLLQLQERGYRHVETRYISFDYGVLLAETASVEARCRRRLTLVRDIARDYETQATNELNKRIERLNNVVKRLTALTVILMIPTLVASHFGMNFAYMPELQVRWAYPAVIFLQVILVALGFFLFKKVGWL
ncbi:MAG: magnesium transporter CorA family protein [Chloroflexi bacterium]|nr:magnesium transporter CorA family protein [Chloroflexota bacterium]